MSSVIVDTAHTPWPERMDKTQFSIVPLSEADGDNIFWRHRTLLNGLQR